MVRIDSHHHLWDPATDDLPWMGDAIRPVLGKRFDVDDLRAVLAPHRIDGAVAVQAQLNLKEGRDLLALAAAPGSPIVGVVAWVDLASPSVGDDLDALRAGPGGDRLVGIRHIVEDEPDPAWLLRPEVQRGIAAVHARGLVYDLLCRPPQWEETLATARAFPNGRFVLDHIAKPRIASGRDAAWFPWIAAIGALPNVDVKLSGMVTEADHRSWQPAQIRPYVDAALDAFGPARAMYGSDWPVCLLASDYPRMIGALESAIAGLSASEQAAIMGGTAVRAYGLRVG